MQGARSQCWKETVLLWPGRPGCGLLPRLFLALLLTLRRGGRWLYLALLSIQHRLELPSALCAKGNQGWEQNAVKVQGTEACQGGRGFPEERDEMPTGCIPSM